MHMHITKAGKYSVFKIGNTNSDVGKEIQNTFTEVCITSGIHDLNLVSHHLYVLLSLLRTSQSFGNYTMLLEGLSTKITKNAPKSHGTLGAIIG